MSWVIVIRDVNLPENQLNRLRHDLQTQLEHALGQRPPTYTIQAATFNHHFGHAPIQPTSHNGGTP